jgi:hypothetical protein
LEPADVEHGGIVDELEVGRRLERPCPHRRWRWTPWRTPWWL